jgi:hypothetical protein
MKTIEDARKHIGAFLAACTDSGMQPDHVRAVLREYLGLPGEDGAHETLEGTPGLRWLADGEPDPHGTLYERERAALTLGQLSDDELANEAFLNYDRRPPVDKLMAGTAFMPIVYMTAVKDRIRWLSRALARATQAAAATN